MIYKKNSNENGCHNCKVTIDVLRVVILCIAILQLIITFLPIEKRIDLNIAALAKTFTLGGFDFSNLFSNSVSMWTSFSNLWDLLYSGTEFWSSILHMLAVIAFICANIWLIVQLGFLKDINILYPAYLSLGSIILIFITLLTIGNGVVFPLHPTLLFILMFLLAIGVIICTVILDNVINRDSNIAKIE